MPAYNCTPDVGFGGGTLLTPRSANQMREKTRDHDETGLVIPLPTAGAALPDELHGYTAPTPRSTPSEYGRYSMAMKRYGACEKTAKPKSPPPSPTRQRERSPSPERAVGESGDSVMPCARPSPGSQGKKSMKRSPSKGSKAKLGAPQSFPDKGHDKGAKKEEPAASAGAEKKRKEEEEEARRRAEAEEKARQEAEAEQARLDAEAEAAAERAAAMRQQVAEHSIAQH